jgi:hypothetical protein
MIVSSGATHGNELAALAYDSSPGTRWTSGTAMQSGIAYWATLDAPSMIAGISATTPETTDVPASWVVAVMDDEGGHGRQEVATGSGPIVATWTPVRGQVVRIECLSADAFFWWSITDLTIDATEIPTEEPPPVEPPVEPPDEEVGPAVFNEILARYWAEKWAKKFNWEVSEPCFVTGPSELLVTQSITYPILRNKGDGIFEPWPFE